MKEDYLHFLWRQKRLPPNLTLVDSREIQIVDFGEYNRYESGPDFKYGKVLIEGLLHVGHIELHINSSDWYKHNHHLDSAYSNVVLHVVLNNDKHVQINGEEVPTLELKTLIDISHYIKFKRSWLTADSIPCLKLFSAENEVEMEVMKSSTLLKRWNKTLSGINENRQEELLYKLFARAFGAPNNKSVFLDLAQNIDLQNVKEIPSNSIHKLLVAESKLISNGYHNNVWKRKGTRPRNFPEIRLRQFSELISKFDFSSFNGLYSVESNHFLFRSQLQSLSNEMDKTIRFTKKYIDHLVINVLVPWLICFHDLDAVLPVLKSIKAESNRYTRKWAEHIFRIDNAYDSQGLMSLYRSHCCRKKCLSCSVGTKLLHGS